MCVLPVLKRSHLEGSPRAVATHLASAGGYHRKCQERSPPLPRRPCLTPSRGCALTLGSDCPGAS